ncbi:MAG: YceH family protein [Burkholderiales bacterium]
MSLPALSLLETRVLGVLVEKQHTVPDTYPLTLNALTAGCNQKTSREPVLDATEAEVQAAVDRLKALSLVVESSGGRVMRYAHNVGRVLGVPAQAVALLAVVMLRGPQTVGELRIHSERLHRFADISSVEAFLAELAQRPAGALMVELPRAPGARETRWAHLLSGAPDIPAAEPVPAGEGQQVTLGELAALKANVSRLQDEVAGLRATVERLAAELGLPPG